MTTKVTLDNIENKVDFNKLEIKTFFKIFNNYRKVKKDEIHNRKKSKLTILVSPRTLKISTRDKKKISEILRFSRRIRSIPILEIFFFCNILRKKNYKIINIILNIFFGNGYIIGFTYGSTKVATYAIKGKKIDRLLYICASSRNNTSMKLTLATYYTLSKKAFSQNKMIDLGGISTKNKEQMNGIDRIKNRFGGEICTHNIKNLI